MLLICLLTFVIRSRSEFCESLSTRHRSLSPERTIFVEQRPFVETSFNKLANYYIPSFRPNQGSQLKCVQYNVTHFDVRFTSSNLLLSSRLSRTTCVNFGSSKSTTLPPFSMMRVESFANLEYDLVIDSTESETVTLSISLLHA
jgi:hypothetical protein